MHLFLQLYLRYSERLFLCTTRMISYLILGPGAMGYFATLGHLQALQDKKELQKVLEISGASSGALTGLMYILYKGDIKKIIKKSLTIDIEKATKLHLHSFLEHYGFICTSHLKDIMRDMCEKMMSNPDPTFQELYEFSDIKYHVSAYCVTDNQTEYFCVDTHPQVKILDIICASFAVPFLFTSVKFNDKLYIDGGTNEKIPALPFLNKDGHKVYAVEIKRLDTMGEQITDLKTYTEKLMRSVLFNNRINYDTIKNKTINLGTINIFDFKMKDFEKIELYVKGYLS